MPEPSPIQPFVSALAHAGLAELLRAGTQPPDCEVVATAKDEGGGLQLVIIVAKYDGPATIDAGTLSRIERFAAAQTHGHPPGQMSGHALTPAQRAIVDVLRGQPPRKALWIASKLGLACGGSFRSRIAEMVRFGVLVKGVEGYAVRCNS